MGSLLNSLTGALGGGAASGLNSAMSSGAIDGISSAAMPGSMGSSGGGMPQGGGNMGPPPQGGVMGGGGSPMDHGQSQGQAPDMSQPKQGGNWTDSLFGDMTEGERAEAMAAMRKRQQAANDQRKGMQQQGMTGYRDMSQSQQAPGMGGLLSMMQQGTNRRR